MEPTTSITVPLRSLWRQAQLLGVAVLLLAGGVAILAVRRSAGAIVFAAVLIALAAVFVGAWWVGRRARALVVDRTGVHWDSTHRPWTVSWTELSQASVLVGFHYGRRSRVTYRRPKRWRVHLELVLADATYAGRHPEMAHLQRAFVGGGPDRYGVPFAQRRELVAPIDAALRAFAGPRYGGVIEQGELRNPGYQPN